MSAERVGFGRVDIPASERDCAAARIEGSRDGLRERDLAGTFGAHDHVHDHDSGALQGSTTGEIEVGRDRDWFAVTLEAGKVYAFDLTRSATGDGTLFDPNLRGIYDDGGNGIAGTANDDSGIDLNSHVIFTADAAGTYCGRRESRYRYLHGGGGRGHVDRG